MHESLINLEEALLTEIVKRPYWSRRAAALLLGINKNTIKPWIEEVAFGLADFRKHAIRAGDKEPLPGYDLDNYQVWVLVKIRALLIEFKASKNGRAYLEEARKTVRANQKYLSFQEFRYQVNQSKAAA